MDLFYDSTNHTINYVDVNSTRDCMGMIARVKHIDGLMDLWTGGQILAGPDP